MSAIYESLNKVIDRVFLKTLLEDSYLANVPRWAIQKVVRIGFKELSLKGSAPSVKSLRLNVQDNNAVNFPVDYLKYLRISWINEIGDLIPIGVNTSITTANQYLLDHQDQILLDNNDIPLVGSGDQDIDREVLRFNHSTTSPYLGDQHYYDGRYFNDDTQNINPTFYGGTEFREDEVNNRIQFAGEKLDTIVLEYLYDPFVNVGNMDELQIPQMFSFALEKWAYNELISGMRSVDKGERQLADREARRTLLEAKLANNIPTINDIIKMTNT
jgi:hypothetical protein